MMTVRKRDVITYAVAAAALIYCVMVIIGLPT